jgi:ATP-dependent Clp protease ATP-binding subunit ClpA
MFERYTEQARRAIFFSRYEACCQPAEKISASHILIGLTRDAGSRADAVGSLIERTSHLRTMLGIPLPAKDARNPELERQIPLDDNAKKVLAYAAEEANVDDSYAIDTDHLLRGILRLPNEAREALQSYSLDLKTARAASKLHRAKFPESKTLYQKLFGSPFCAHRVLVIKLLAIVAVCLLSGLLLGWFR